MKRLARIFCFGLLMLPLFLTPDRPVVAGPGGEDAATNIPVIEVSLAGKEPLTVPVIAKKKRSLLPVAGASISAIAVDSWVEEGGPVKFDIRAISDPLPEKRSCDTIKQLKGEVVGSYTGRPGDTIRVAALEKFGVAAFNVKVMSMPAAQRPPVCPETCCCYGIVACCPEPGKCLQCGGGGQCCIIG